MAAVVLQWLLWFVVPAVAPDAGLVGLFGGIFFCGLAVLVWWLFLSRAPWPDRLGALVLMVLAVIATKPLVHCDVLLVRNAEEVAAFRLSLTSQ